MTISESVIRHIVNEFSIDKFKIVNKEIDVIFESSKLVISKMFLDRVYQSALKFPPAERPLFRARVIGLAICLELKPTPLEAMNLLQTAKLSKAGNITVPITKKEVDAYLSSMSNPKYSKEELISAARQTHYQ